MKTGDLPHLVEHTAFYCEKQERRAHAEFFFGMTPAQRSEFAAPGEHPWRGIMDPTLLGVINILEDAGHYDGLGAELAAMAS